MMGIFNYTSCSQHENQEKLLLKVQMNPLSTGRALDQITVPRITTGLLQHNYAFISKPKFLIKYLKNVVNSDHKCTIAEVP